jgi:replication factor A1
MIKVPYEEIRLKIIEKTMLPADEVEQKVKDKLQQFSGLISKEGAAHIVANELGVKIIENAQGKLVIKNILSGMRSVDTLGKIIRLDPPKTFQRGDRSGSIASMTIADESGSIRVVAWGDQTRVWPTLKTGDIIKIVGSYVRDNNNQIEIHVNDRSRLIVNPKGETVGEVKIPQSKQGSVRKTISNLTENDQGIELQGVVIQAFEPRFFEVCKECGKRTLPADGGFSCPVHGQVTPDISFVSSVVLDDGSDTIRITCFRDQVTQMLGKSRTEILKFRESPELATNAKQEIIGKIMSFTGRTRKNDVLGRVEFIAQSVNPSPNPEEELKRLGSL